MRAQTIALRFGDQEWRVRPLTLKQIQEIEPLLQAADQGGGQSIAAAIKIIGVALARDHQDTAARLAEIEATTQEIGQAMRDVLRLGGFIAAVDAQEQDLGNVAAGADGPSSTPA